MIKFSKNNWHYRFNNFVKYDLGIGFYATKAKSLCPYFWCTLCNILIFTLFLLVIYLGCLMLSALFLSLGTDLEEVLSNLPYWALYIWLLTPIVMSIVFFASVFIMEGFITIKDYSFNKFKKYTGKSTNTCKEQKKPSLLLEWIKATKQKVCPFIEWEEK